MNVTRGGFGRFAVRYTCCGAGASIGLTIVGSALEVIA